MDAPAFAPPRDAAAASSSAASGAATHPALKSEPNLFLPSSSAGAAPRTATQPHPVFRCIFQGCGKEFARRNTLKAHVRLHTGEKPFACTHPTCARTFKWRSSLRCHLDVHAYRLPGPPRPRPPPPAPEAQQPQEQSQSQELQQRVAQPFVPSHSNYVQIGLEILPEAVPDSTDESAATGSAAIPADPEPTAFNAAAANPNPAAFEAADPDTLHPVFEATDPDPDPDPDQPGAAAAAAAVPPVSTPVPASEFSPPAPAPSSERPRGGTRCEQPGCGKRFTRNNNLLAHRRLHTGVKPYVCESPGCGEAFMWKSSMTHHRQKHENENPVEGAGIPSPQRQPQRQLHHARPQHARPTRSSASAAAAPGRLGEEAEGGYAGEEAG